MDSLFIESGLHHNTLGAVVATEINKDITTLITTVLTRYPNVKRHELELLLQKGLLIAFSRECTQERITLAKG